MFSDLIIRLRALFQHSAVERELDDELRFHFDQQIEKLVRSGLSIQEARRQSFLIFGGAEQIKEQCREARGVHFLETLVQDIRYALRILGKSPGYTAIAVSTLALGIGANTAIFSVIDGMLLSSLPYKNPKRLVAMNHNDSLINVIDIQRENRSFSQGGGINVESMDYIGGSEPARVHAAFVDAGFFEVLGVPPMLGRVISPDEDIEGGPHVVVVSHHFWQKYLSSDPHVLGKEIHLSGNSFTVIGVMPASFSPPREHADLYVSLWVAYPEAAPFRGVHFMHVYWRLKPGVTLGQAQADISQIDRQLADQYPDNERDRKTVLVPLHQWLTGDVRAALLILFGAVGLVLFIACANFAGLQMARVVARRQEMVIRAALGAGRNRLVRQALTESVLLSLLGGTAGLLLAELGTTLLLSFKPAALDRFNGIQMDARVLLFALGVSIATGIAFGLAPAWSSACARLAEALRPSGRSTTTDPSGHRLRRLLVTTELALALILLIGAGLLVRGFSRLRAVNPGFNPSGVLAMDLQLPATRYAKIPQQTQFRRELLSRLNSLPDVQAAMISDIPLGGGFVSHNLVIAGRPPLPTGSEPEVQTLSVMGDYFDVMQIPIRAGRNFTPMDREGQPLVAIVNEEMANKLFPHENPLGARIDWTRTTGPHQWMTIIGVVADVKHSGLDQPTDPAVYAPFSQSDEAWRRWMTLAIRTPSLSTGLGGKVKKQVWSLDDNLPVSDVQMIDDLMRESLAKQRFNMLLLGLIAALALTLAAIGIYGLISYGVNQRTHEIGIRMALGSQRGTVLRVVMGEGAQLAFLGIAIGIAGALALTHVMKSLLFEVKPSDPVTFAVVAALLAIVSLFACYIPARRAMRIDPMVALRYE